VHGIKPRTVANLRHRQSDAYAICKFHPYHKNRQKWPKRIFHVWTLDFALDVLIIGATVLSRHLQ
jgi:hypothetical protein